MNDCHVSILSHFNSQTRWWQSNYEKFNFWPARKNKGFTTHYFLTTLNAVMASHDSNYKIHVEDYADSKTGFYLIFYGDPGSMIENQGLGFVTPEQVDKINSGSLKLFVVFTHETFDTGVSFNDWFLNFCQLLNEIEIKKFHSVLILINTHCADAWPNDPRCQISYYPWLEADSQSMFLQKKMPRPVIDFEKKKKYFINLNFRIRAHRYLMVSYLKYQQVDHLGHLSWKNPQNQTYKEVSNSRQHQIQLGNFDNDHEFFHFIRNNRLPSVELDQLTHDTVWTGPNEFYQDACVDLVSETHAELFGNVILTEKTFKPLAHGLPFVFNASQYHLEHLKTLGYHSFPELFDESYDQMPSSMQKIALVGDQIVNFCRSPDKINFLKNSSETLEKIQHNQQLFWTKNHADTLGKLLWKFWNQSA